MISLDRIFQCIILRDDKMNKYKNKDFLSIVEPVLQLAEFKELIAIEHHGITRYDHSLRVAYHTYKITKLLHLNYKEATVAALLHDFFTDEVDEEGGVYKLRRHPSYAVKNASRYFELSELQEDIIMTHMFPVTFTPPKYMESWIVDIVDDVASVYERIYSTKRQLSAGGTLLFLLLMNYFNIR